MESGDETTRLVRLARGGDADGLGQLVQRLSPLLTTQARFRAARSLPDVDPDELVQEVWLRAIPRLPELDARDGRHTPVVVRFLATTLLNLTNELVRSRIRARRTLADGGSDAPGVSALPDETVGVVSRALRSERHDELTRALVELTPEERELVVLRGIEQQDNQDVAALLGQTPNAVSLRYNRLLRKLRDKLRGGLFDEWRED
ncbi:MAG: sigma-70 family RNA polymerase sigma factor [Planctomycetes bacterium]|nr:sigma-70 family RNA polymerase sigma factor [Planctomycetota bacterium]